MDWFRSTTTLAVAAGAVLGALAAIVGPTPPATPSPSSSRPFRPVAQIGAPPATVAARPDSAPPNEPGPTEPAASVAPVVSAASPPRSDEDVQAAALACARGDGAACLRAAAGRELSGQNDHAALLRQLAVQRFAEGCQGRQPEACFELARLYRDGIGVERNLATSKALYERVDSLCRAKPNDFCAMR